MRCLGSISPYIQRVHGQILPAQCLAPVLEVVATLGVTFFDGCLCNLDHLPHVIFTAGDLPKKALWWSIHLHSWCLDEGVSSVVEGGAPTFRGFDRVGYSLDWIA